MKKMMVRDAVTREERAFIYAAVSKDPLNTRLTYPFVQKVAGDIWLVATDGHRMHAVRAPEDVEEGHVSVVADGYVCMMPRKRFHNMSTVPVNNVWTIPGKHTAKTSSDRLWAVSAGAALVEFNPERASLPMFHYDGDQTNADSVYVSGAYIRDALRGMVQKRGRFHDMEVRVRFDGSLEPVVLEENAEMPMWRAVVMPMRARGA
jgi:hypothetical protein